MQYFISKFKLLSVNLSDYIQRSCLGLKYLAVEMSYVNYPFVFVMVTFQTVVSEGNLQVGNQTPLFGKDKEGFSQLNSSIQQLADLLEQRVQEVETTLTQYLNETKKEILSCSCKDEDTVEQINESKIVFEVSEVMKELLAPILHCHLEINLGKYECNPAKSCHQIKELVPESPSGYYYVKQNTGPALSVYCDMTRSCRGISGGWMKVASFDVDNSSHSCPSGLHLLTDHKRRCVMPSDGAGCASTMLDVHVISYQRVCGTVIGYQKGTTDAFANFVGSHSIEGAYVDGIGLTHGRNPRHHIWTFASAADESDYHGSSIIVCPCTNHQTTTVQVPNFVGSNYFCDTGSHERFEFSRLYHEDPLWDGAGCGGSSTCCSFNNPPWFMRDLSPPGTTDDIELRVCRDEPRSNEDVGLKSVELYVQ